MKPAAAKRLGRRLGVVVVALHHDVAARDDLADGLAVVRDFLALVVDDPHVARRHELDALPGLDGARAARAESAACAGSGWQIVMSGRRLGQPVDVRDLPAEFAFDAADGRRRRRRASREHFELSLSALRRTSSGALARPMSTVGAAQNFVIDSRSMSSKTRFATGCRRQTCVPPAAVTIHVNVQPLAWNIGSVQRYRSPGPIGKWTSRPTELTHAFRCVIITPFGRAVVPLV